MENLKDNNGILCATVQPHFYNGNGNQTMKCQDCGKEADDFIHYRNGGVVCDNPDGACSCGATHKE